MVLFSPRVCFKGHRERRIGLWGPLLYWISIILSPKKVSTCTDILVSVNASKSNICWAGGAPLNFFFFWTANLVNKMPWLDDTDHALEN